jgi:serine/threonine protein kinase
MGVVYLACDVSCNQHVALKVLGMEHANHANLVRFSRESESMLKLHHPGISRLRYAGHDGCLHFLVTDYIDGLSLRRIIEELQASETPLSSIDSLLVDAAHNEDVFARALCGETTESYDSLATPPRTSANRGGLNPLATQLITSRMYIERCCQLAREAASAIGYAHAMGVVHRDIKPENIMLGRDGRIRVIDFGLARHLGDLTVTRTGALVGTPVYMSPEQVTGRLEVDYRTDVYSLGLVLYELLTLKTPMMGTTREWIYRQIIMKPLPPLRRRNASVPIALESIVHRATAKDPDLRYKNAQLLAEDLGNYLERRPISATAYHYVPDNREIGASRPGWIVTLVFFLYFSGVISILAAAATFGRLLVLIDPAINVTVSMVFSSVVVIFVVVFGGGLLTARSWAFKGTIAWFVLVGGLVAGLVLELFVRREHYYIESAIGAIIWCVIALTFWGVAISLRRKDARNWIREARRIRSEN